MDSELNYFDAIIDISNKYLDALKRAVEEDELQNLKNWFSSVIYYISDMREVLIYCKNKLQITVEKTKSSVNPVTFTPLINSKPKLTILNQSDSYIFPKDIQNFTTNFHPNVNTIAIQNKLLTTRTIENKQSIVFMNIPESNTLNHQNKLNSDRTDIETIMKKIGITPNIQKIYRFSPKKLPSHKTSFIKIHFSNAEEKKMVLNAVKSNIHIIRSINIKFSEITVSDPDKSESKNTNSNTYQLPLKNKTASPTKSPINSSMNICLNNLESSNPCNKSSNITFRSSCNKNQHFSSNLAINNFASTNTIEKETTPNEILQQSTTKNDLIQRNINDTKESCIHSSNQNKKIIQQTLKPTSKKYCQSSPSAYTRGLPEDKYTSEEEN